MSQLTKINWSIYQGMNTGQIIHANTNHFARDS